MSEPIPEALVSVSIIAANDLFILSAVIFSLVAFGFWADTNKIGQKTSGALWVMVLALILSNTGVIPYSSSLYDMIFTYVVPVSIPLLLLKANLGTIFKECGAVLITFMFAAAATAIACISGYYLLELGEIGPKVAGVYTGGWIGGTMNFVAVSQAVGMTKAEFSAAIAANSPVSIMALMILVVLPSIGFIKRFVPSKVIEETGDFNPSDTSDKSAPRMMLNHISAALALSFTICAISFLIADYFNINTYGLLVVTTLTIIVANLIPRQLQKLEGEFNLGMYLMYLFFAVVGAGTDLTTFFDSALNLFFYSIYIVVFHIGFVLICAKLFKFDLAEIVIASAAAIVGPAPAAAIAISRGWKELVTPAIMCGMFGYVIANFIGVAVTMFLS